MTISPILRSLHWLSVHSRITFKILHFVYKITHNLASKYLQDLVSLRSSSSARSLRSSSSMQLIHGPRTKIRYDDRAFSCIAPILRNKLPPHILNAPSVESFNTLLKTHLFNHSLLEAYTSSWFHLIYLYTVLVILYLYIFLSYWTNWVRQTTCALRNARIKRPINVIIIIIITIIIIINNFQSIISGYETITYYLHLQKIPLDLVK